jgi:bifunctional DNase/RNase
MIEAVLEDIAVAGDGNQFLVLLRTKDDDILPIVIDALQAISIAAGRNQEKIERPLTHDLLLSLIQLFDAQIDRIEITDLVDGTYYAILVLDRGGVQFEVDARPSDAMALAVRVKAPIWIAEHVLEQNALTEDYGGGSGESFQA